MWVFSFLSFPGPPGLIRCSVLLKSGARGIFVLGRVCSRLSAPWLDARRFSSAVQCGSISISIPKSLDIGLSRIGLMSHVSCHMSYVIDSCIISRFSSHALNGRPWWLFFLFFFFSSLIAVSPLLLLVSISLVFLHMQMPFLPPTPPRPLIGRHPHQPRVFSKTREDSRLTMPATGMGFSGFEGSIIHSNATPLHVASHYGSTSQRA